MPNTMLLLLCRYPKAERERLLLLASLITSSGQNTGKHTYCTVDVASPNPTSTRTLVSSTSMPPSTKPFSAFGSVLHNIVASLATKRAGQPVIVVRCQEFIESKCLVFDLGGPGAHYCPFQCSNHQSYKSYYVVKPANYQFRQRFRDPSCVGLYTPWYSLDLSDDERKQLDTLLVV